MRVEGKCIGDCSQCALLEEGSVDMIPCILDQIFIRVKKQEKEISKLTTLLDELSAGKNTVALAGIDNNEKT